MFRDIIIIDNKTAEIRKYRNKKISAKIEILFSQKSRVASICVRKAQFTEALYRTTVLIS